MSISALPPELIFSIFEFLDPVSRGRAACVCSQWQELANDEVLWKTDCIARGITARNGATWKEAVLVEMGYFTRRPCKHRFYETAIPITTLFASQKGVCYGWQTGDISVPEVVRVHPNPISSIVRVGDHVFSTALGSMVVSHLNIEADTLALDVHAPHVTIVGGDREHLYFCSPTAIYRVDHALQEFTLVRLLPQTCSAAHYTNGALYLGSASGALIFFSEGEFIHLIKGHEEEVTALTTQGAALFTCSKDRSIGVWNRFTLEKIHHINTVHVPKGIGVVDTTIYTVEQGSVCIRTYEELPGDPDTESESSGE